MFCHGMTDRSAIREGRALSRPYMRPRRSAALPCAALPCAVDTVQVTEQVTTSTAQVAPPVAPPVTPPVAPSESTNPTSNPTSSLQVTLQVNRLLAVIDGDMPRSAIMEALSLSDRVTFTEDYLRPAIRLGLIELTQPDSPRSPTQKYRLTAKGRTAMTKLHKREKNTDEH